MYRTHLKTRQPSSRATSRPTRTPSSPSSPSAARRRALSLRRAKTAPAIAPKTNAAADARGRRAIVRAAARMASVAATRRVMRFVCRHLRDRLFFRARGERTTRGAAIPRTRRRSRRMNPLFARMRAAGMVNDPGGGHPPVRPGMARRVSASSRARRVVASVASSSVSSPFISFRRAPS